MLDPPDDLTSKVVVALITAILGGVVVALINWMITRKKTAAEIAKITLETEKIRRELHDSINEVNTRISRNERMIYDGTSEMSGFDFKGHGDRFFGQDRTAPKGEGSLIVVDNILRIERYNTDGRYRVILHKYTYDSKTTDYIPKNPVLENAEN